MKKIFKIFLHDLWKITNNVVALVVIIGLISLPCVYCWTNLLSSWSPYSDLEAIKIGVYSRDEGFYVGDVYVNIGDIVVESLRENDSVGWLFYGDMLSEDASEDEFEKMGETVVDDVYAGETYAAFVIPEDFSEKLVQFMDDDMTHPTIAYYENQKKNAIVPKITAQVKTTVQNEVNKTIITQISTVFMSASNFFAGKEGNITSASVETLENLNEDLTSYINILNSFIYITQSAETLMSSSKDLIPDLNGIVKNGQNTIHSMENILVTGSQKINEASASLDAALYMIQSQISGLIYLVSQETGAVNDAASTVKGDVDLMKNQLELLKMILDSSQDMSSQEIYEILTEQLAQSNLKPEDVEKIIGQLDFSKFQPGMTQEEVKTLLQDAMAQAGVQSEDGATDIPADNREDIKNQIQEQMKARYDELGQKIEVLTGDLEEIQQLADTALTDGRDLRETLVSKLIQCEQDFKEVQNVYNTSLKGAVNNVNTSLYTSLIKVSGLLNNINVDFDSINGSLDEFASILQTGNASLTDSKTMAESLNAKLEEMIAYLDELQKNDQYQALVEMLENDPEKFADFVAVPTQINENSIFPISDAEGNSYASAMSSFYSVLALYLAALFCMVMIHARLKRSQYTEIEGRLTPLQQYVGRWLTFACVSVLTSTILALGDLLFIEVQCEHPIAFILSMIMIGLVFNFFAYSCAYGLGLIGEAFALLCMILSVACSSSFPFEMLPGIFGKLNQYNLIVFQPGMNMLKETIAGYNGVDYWIYFIRLFAYVIAGAFIALGISRIPPVHWICEFFEKRKNDSHVML